MAILSVQVDLDTTVTEKAADKSADKSKNYTVTINLDSGSKKFLKKTLKDFDSLLGLLKKLDPESFSKLKIPQKKLFKDVSKQRLAFINQIVKTVFASQVLTDDEGVKLFFNFKASDKLEVLGDDFGHKQNAPTTSAQPPAQPAATPTPTNTNTPTNNNTDDLEVDLGQTGNAKAKPGDFEFLKVIGKGSFGSVYLARHLAEDKHYAVKVLLKKFIVKRNESRHIMAERNVLLKNLKHPFLVALHYSFQTRDKLYFVLTYVNGGELFFHLQREKSFPEKRVRFYVAELCLALGYLHTNNIIYRDLKPENILLDNKGHVVLTDFGLAKELASQEATTKTFCGTPEYLAPEILMKMAYTMAIDWWCVGCVMYELLFGLPPFYNNDVNVMYSMILHQPVQFRAKMSKNTMDIILRLLEKNYELRLGYGVAGVEAVKAHPFFSGIDFVLLFERKLEPPFNPDVCDDVDTKNIDTEFTEEAVPESLIPTDPRLQKPEDDDNNPFLGFTYVPDQERLG